MAAFRLLTRMVWFSGLAAACLLAAATWMGSDLARGAMHRGQDAREVVADVLPPPLYLVELRLLLEMVASGSVGPEAAAVERDRLAGAYRARLAHWHQHESHLPAHELLDRPQAAAERLLAAAGPLLQAARAGDSEATAAALQRVHALYLEHRRAVDATVRHANAYADQAEAEIGRVSRLALAATLGLFVLTLALLVFNDWHLRRPATARVAPAP